jgi:hypothetical protein|tara:strand:+ start:7799 stop:8308 length:510 start_codon:yes stop_codon:yes gene_type:complete
MSENIPIPTGYNVYWEKWVDAYETNVEVLDYEEDEEEIFGDEGLDLSFHAPEEDFEKNVKSIQTIFTPFGMMPLTEHSLASKYFKFWVGHTNFAITHAFHSIISNMEGVETLDVFTPYRFRISVGKLFRDRDVMARIKDAMVGHIRETKNMESSRGKNPVSRKDIRDVS